MLTYVIQFHKSKELKARLHGLPIDTRKKLIEIYFSECKAKISAELENVEVFAENAFMLSIGIKGSKSSQLRKFILDNDLGIVYQSTEVRDHNVKVSRGCTW